MALTEGYQYANSALCLFVVEPGTDFVRFEIDYDLEVRRQPPKSLNPLSHLIHADAGPPTTTTTTTTTTTNPVLHLSGHLRLRDCDFG